MQPALKHPMSIFTHVSAPTSPFPKIRARHTAVMKLPRISPSSILSRMNKWALSPIMRICPGTRSHLERKHPKLIGNDGSTGYSFFSDKEPIDASVNLEAMGDGGEPEGEYGNPFEEWAGEPGLDELTDTGTEKSPTDPSEALPTRSSTVKSSAFIRPTGEIHICLRAQQYKLQNINATISCSNHQRGSMFKNNLL
ncbi:hypothetical protein CR513_18697, partial [Mucuna pruriens]